MHLANSHLRRSKRNKALIFKFEAVTCHANLITRVTTLQRQQPDCKRFNEIRMTRKEKFGKLARCQRGSEKTFFSHLWDNGQCGKKRLPLIFDRPRAGKKELRTFLIFATQQNLVERCFQEVGRAPHFAFLYLEGIFMFVGLQLLSAWSMYRTLATNKGEMRLGKKTFCI